MVFAFQIRDFVQAGSQSGDWEPEVYDFVINFLCLLFLYKVILTIRRMSMIKVITLIFKYIIIFDNIAIVNFIFSAIYTVFIVFYDKKFKIFYLFVNFYIT